LKGRAGSKFGTLIRLKTAVGLDAVMCALINAVQWPLRHLVCTPAELDGYLSACEAISRGLFYEVPGISNVILTRSFLQWPSPVKSAFQRMTLHARAFFSRPWGYALRQSFSFMR